MDQTKIWEHFQTDDRAAEIAFSARARYQFLADRITAHEKVLNVGVGRGGLEEILIARRVDVSCLDPSETSINGLRERLHLGGKARVGFSQSMPFPDGAFDAVIMSEVLEHLPNEVLKATLTEVRRVLTADGRFMGTVPADENLTESRVVCPHCGEIFHRWGHVQSFTRSRLYDLLRGQFDRLRISRHFFEDPARLNWKGKASLIAKRAALALGLRGSGETFFFEAFVR